MNLNSITRERRNELVEEVKDWMKVTKGRLDMNRLPKWQREVMSGYLIPILNGVPVSLILNALNAKTAQACQVPKLTIESDKGPIFCNLYALTFFHSGGGKDNTTTTLQDKIFNKFNCVFEDKRELYKDKKKAANEVHCKNKWGAEPKGVDKTSVKEYMKSHEPRNLILHSRTGTAEGLTEERLGFHDAGFGGAFFQNSEFVGFMVNSDNTGDSLIDYMADAYEGDTGGKSIKSSNVSTEVKGVPHSLLAYSSTAGMHKNGAFEKLITVLERQYARRSYICYPFPFETEKTEFDDADLADMVNEKINNVDNVINQYPLEPIQLAFEDIGNMPAPLTAKFSNEARFCLETYDYLCKRNGDRLKAQNKNALSVEVKARAWKTRKLCGPIQLVKDLIPNHNGVSAYPTAISVTFAVSKETVLEAINQSEFFGCYYEPFYKAEPETMELNLYNWFVKEKLDHFVSLSDIRSASKFKGNNFKFWVKEAMEYIEERGSVDGYKLEVKKVTRGGVKYMLTKEDLEFIPGAKSE